MNKKLILCAFVALLCLSCSKKDEPQPTKQVTFNVASMYQTTEPMNNAPRRAPILDDSENGQELTDLYVFDGTTQLAHQTNYMQDFGTITLNLAHGNHNLSFVCTRSTGLSYNAGVLSATSLRPTFGKLLTLNVTSNTPAQDLMLDRISGQMVITIQDAFPANADEIEFVINPRYSAIDVTTLSAVNGTEVSQRVSCSNKVGKTDQSYTFTTLCPSLTDEYTADVTINVYNSSDAVIYSVSIADVRLASNTKTLLSGNLFTSPSASVAVNTTWNSNIVGTW